MITLKPHQVDAFNSVVTAITSGKGSAVGRIVMPTGAGKTFVEAAVIDYQRHENSQSRIHLVLAPRILLANQLIGEFRIFSGLDYRVIAFHSGHYEPDDETVPWKEANTTQFQDVIDAHTAALKNNQDLVVFSTYHSCAKLKDIQFDTIIADESQYCVAENFNEAIKQLNGRVRMFFTATERFTSSNKGKGLNNEELFGQRLYYISPAELVRLGLIVPPRMHIMYGETRNEEASIISEVLEIAKEQDKLTNPDLGFSKILFAMKGTSDVKTIVDNVSKIHKEMPGFDICTITSNSGARINGKEIPREQFIRELKDRKNCLIFHYDILSEGIDVDGITGVALMRNLGLSKLLQTIGRAIRIFKPNPSLKKQAWISVPVINGDEDDKARVKEYINAIRNGGHDISQETVWETGIERHAVDDEGVDDAYTTVKNNYSNLFIEEIFHEIEDDDFWTSVNSAGNTEQQLDKFLEMVNDEA